MKTKNKDEWRKDKNGQIPKALELKTQSATKTSARFARNAPDTAVGIEGQGSSLAENQFLAEEPN